MNFRPSCGPEICWPLHCTVQQMTPIWIISQSRSTKVAITISIWLIFLTRTFNPFFSFFLFLDIFIVKYLQKSFVISFRPKIIKLSTFVSLLIHFLWLNFTTFSHHQICKVWRGYYSGAIIIIIIIIILGLKLIITLSQFTIKPVILIIYGHFWTDVFEVQGFNKNNRSNIKRTNFSKINFKRDCLVLWI